MKIDFSFLKIVSSFSYGTHFRYKYYATPDIIEWLEGSEEKLDWMNEAIVRIIGRWVYRSLALIALEFFASSSLAYLKDPSLFYSCVEIMKKYIMYTKNKTYNDYKNNKQK